MRRSYVFLIPLFLLIPGFAEAGYYGSHKIDDYLTVTANTHIASTGAVTDATSINYYIYEDTSNTEIASGSMAKLDDADTTGLYRFQQQLTAAVGFEKGKSYNIMIRAAVGSVTGAITHNFQIEAEVDANTVSPTVTFDNTTINTATNVVTVTTVTNGLTTSNVNVSAGIVESNVKQLDGNTIQQASGYTKISSGTGAGQVKLSSGDVTAENERGTDNAFTAANGTTHDNRLQSAMGSGFSEATDSQESIRDRGDAAWTTGSGTGLTSLATGTAQAGAAGSITLTAGASATTDFFKGARIALTSNTGVGQSRMITAYNGTTKVATIVPNWATNPDATTGYEIQAADSHTGLIEAADPSDTIRDAIVDDATRFSGADINDWADGGRLDLLLDAIKAVTDNLPDGGALNDLNTLVTRLTAARAGYLDNLSAGSVALASVCTEARLAELGSTNIPSDVDVILTRLSAARAGYLDNLSAGAVALEATLTAMKGGGWSSETLVTIEAAILALNDLSAAQVNTEADTALSDYAPATAAALSTHDDKIASRVTSTRMQELDSSNIPSDIDALNTGVNITSWLSDTTIPSTWKHSIETMVPCTVDSGISTTSFTATCTTEITVDDRPLSRVIYWLLGSSMHPGEGGLCDDYVYSASGPDTFGITPQTATPQAGDKFILH